MTEVINTCDSVGGASGEEVMAFQLFPDSAECFQKLSRRLPSIVVEPIDGDDVESGELRWPPDDVSSDVTEGHAQVQLYLWKGRSHRSRGQAEFKTDVASLLSANQCAGLCDERRGGAISPVAPPTEQGGGVR